MTERSPKFIRARTTQAVRLDDLLVEVCKLPRAQAVPIIAAVQRYAKAVERSTKIALKEAS